MKNTIPIKKTIKYQFVHPLFSQPIFDRFDPFLAKLWQKSTMMFHVGRSGSTVLANLLGQAEEIFWDNEVYFPFLDYLSQLKKQGWNFQTDRFPFEGVKIVRNSMALAKILHPNKKIFGAECKFYHLRKFEISIKSYLDYLDYLGFNHFIILERKNYLRAIVSSIISNKKLQNFHIDSQTKPSLNRIRVDIDNLRTDSEQKHLLQFLQDHQDDFQNLKNLLKNRQVLYLTYEEDISENPQLAMKRVCKFLDIKYQKGKIKYGKTNPFPLKEIIINYDEVKQALRGTSFEWMIDR